jgi:hypothetical protein
MAGLRPAILFLREHALHDDGMASAGESDWKCSTMMTPEETRVLTHLRTRLLSTVDEIVAACLPGASLEEATRILWNLEWLGYVVCYGSDAVQITGRGAAAS